MAEHDLAVKFDRKGPTGNIFYVIGMAYSLLCRNGRRQDAEAMVAKAKTQHSYDEALEAIAEFVDLEEVSEYESRKGGY